MEFAAQVRHQHGVFTRAQARAAGFTDRQISHRLRTGQWQRYFTQLAGVLADAGLPHTYRSRLWATTLAVGEPTWLAVHTAAARYGWCSAPDQIQVAVPQGRRVTAPPGARLWRLADTGLALSRDGLPHTPADVTLTHCLRFLPLGQARDVLDRSQQLSGPPLDRVADLLPFRGPGTAQARQLLAAVDGARFAAERLAVRTLRRGGITDFVLNWRVVASGRVVVVDIAFPDLRIAVEIDGFAHHSDVARFQSDRARQNALVRDGWLVLRFT